MSIEIDWQTLTTGPDGLALAESIRSFIHDKFQQVALPGFIRAVQIHAFEFGDEPPLVELKDVCDPLPDFYEDDSGEDDDDDDDEDDDPAAAASHNACPPPPPPHADSHPAATLRSRRASLQRRDPRPAATPQPLSFIDTRRSGLRQTDLLPRTPTPSLPGGIPGGTSNLHRFPLGATLPGTHTPLAAVSAAFQDHHHSHHAFPWDGIPRAAESPPARFPRPRHSQTFSNPDPSTRPSTARSRPGEGEDEDEARSPSLDGSAEGGGGVRELPEGDPMDVQVVLRIRYAGNVRLALTAEILLDYPMPSFVGIPLQLRITGVSFDGVALLAYLRRRAHFCFLGQEDAEVLVGTESAVRGEGEGVSADAGHGTGDGAGDKLGGLLKEIRVESEIGQKEGGKQVLKNVGKVERFVLEQVRRIFEDEFVYPSYYTFLV